MTTPKIQSRFDIRKCFAQGESLVATTGMAFIAILAFAVGGVVWVSARTIDDSASAQAEEQILETSALIASQAELRLSDNDFPGLRRLLLDAVASGVVEECEISAPDIGVIVSSNAAQGTLSQMPESWQAAPDIAASILHNDETNRTTIHEPLIVNGKSGMALKVIVNRSLLVVGSDSIRMSSVIIMCVGLILMLLVYRRFRNRLGALAGIGEALRAAGDGERRIECLVVGERLGSEAVIWNTLLKEREEIEQVVVQRETLETLSGGVVESVGLPAACNTLTQGVLLVEQDLQVLYANGAACVFLRVNRQELINSSLNKVPDSAGIVEIVQSMLDGQGASRQIIELGDVEKIESQGAVLRVVITRVDEDEVPRAMVFIEDVTQQRLADQSQNAFIAQATHELRTPLTTIRLYAEEAVDAGSDDEQIRDKALNVINSETRRLERIVGDMLCVSEIEAGSLSIRSETMRPGQLFTELEEDYQAQAKDKSIELVFELPPKFPSIMGDRDRLGQALHNLVGNAIKYTPSGGSVHVKVHFADNNAMTVDVVDTGIGIEDSQQERIFDRFCRADDRRISQVTGSGLGLALARQIARLHNGDVEVKSEIDKGSTFTLTIPGTEQMAKAA
jgi:signal transduction histidine kinase